MSVLLHSPEDEPSEQQTPGADVAAGQKKAQHESARTKQDATPGYGYPPVRPQLQYASHPDRELPSHLHIVKTLVFHDFSKK